jgi:hypothetical protein
MRNILRSALMWAVVWGIGGWLFGDSRGAVVTWQAGPSLVTPNDASVPCSVVVAIFMLGSVLIWGTIRGAIAVTTGSPTQGAILGAVNGCASGLIAFFVFMRIGGETTSLPPGELPEWFTFPVIWTSAGILAGGAAGCLLEFALRSGASMGHEGSEQPRPREYKRVTRTGVLALSAGLLYVYSLWPSSSDRKFDRIQIGVDMADVTQILGEPIPAAEGAKRYAPNGGYYWLDNAGWAWDADDAFIVVYLEGNRVKVKCLYLKRGPEPNLPQKPNRSLVYRFVDDVISLLKKKPPATVTVTPAGGAAE